MSVSAELEQAKPSDDAAASAAQTATTGSARNQCVADRLREAADLLAGTGADPFRVAAYRKASETIHHLDRDIGEIAQAGAAALDDLPGVGRSIAGALMQMLQTGRWPFLEHLRGVADPVHVFQQIPRVGPQLAKRIHDHLGVSTLQELEVAAHQGRLSEVPRLGPRRAMMVRAALADLLSRIRPPDAHKVHEPDVALLLDVDREYHERAHELPKIVPSRFNPEREAWLPVLHTRRGEWIFTALFSNTARAHELGKTHDWVVIFFHSDQDLQSQCTIVTKTQSHLRGLRVVRGREHECELFYGSNRDPALRPS